MVDDIETRLRASLREVTGTTPLTQPDHPGVAFSEFEIDRSPTPGRRRPVRLLVGAIVVVIVLAGFGVALAYGPHSAPPGPSGVASNGGTVATTPVGMVGSADPPLLTDTGIAIVPGMTQVVATTSSVDDDKLKDLSAIFTPTGNLYQIFVDNDAVTQYGGFNQGLPLPLPTSFAALHPGVNEVTVTVLRFTSAEPAQRLLKNPSFNESNDRQITTLRQGRFDGGVALEDNSPPNNVPGMHSFTLLWARGRYLIRLSVEGYAVAISDADNLAALVLLPPDNGRTSAVILPTDGWKPGQPSESALTGGSFHATMTAQGPCAWLGNTPRPFLWPAGYAVRFHPTELIDAAGHVVARQGQKIYFGGGFEPAAAATGTDCAASGQQIWAVQSAPTRSVPK